MGEYKDFDDCIRKVMEKKGISEESAKKYCGKIKSQVEGSGESDISKLVHERRIQELSIPIEKFIKAHKCE